MPLRLRILKVPADEGPMELGRLLEMVSSDLDPSPAVMSLGCANLLELDLTCQSACKFDPSSASNFDPFARRALLVALVSSELAGIAEARRARVA
ncbi:hypothetical protein [Bradyrhizobium diazoefficiens]|uniref:hypothetical protein n=1 Tax=Bradyrhizobium diazoefficiens TaxID=1355477 RepID=UPI001FF04F63|nr:hypothetical protein [Bradyrhizobium diazoefficiens]